MRYNTKEIGRSKIKPHERIRAGAGAGGSTSLGLVLFTKGPDFGFHLIHVSSAGAGLEANATLNFFAGNYNGNPKYMKSDFKGLGAQASGKIFLGAGLWGSKKVNNTVGWFGFSFGIGPSGGSSADVTSTNYIEPKTKK